MRPFMTLIVILLVYTYCPAQDGDVKQLLAQEEQPIQEQINRVSEALKNHPQLDPTSNVAAFEEIQNLKNIVASKFEIVKQIAVLAAKPGEGQPLYSRAILDLLDLPPKFVIRTLAPYLNADNKNLRSFVRDWFQAHDNAGSDVSALEEVNYEDYMEYVRGQLNMSQEVPAAFTEYIYERHPGKALLVFAYADRQSDVVSRLQEMRKNLDARLQQENQGQGPIPPPPPAKGSNEILLAEHIVSNAVWLKRNDYGEQFQQALPEAQQQLAKLGEHDQWWARLYVVEIMRRHQELRDPNVLDKLREDDHELVSKAAKSIRL